MIYGGTSVLLEYKMFESCYRGPTNLTFVIRSPLEAAKLHKR